MFINVWQIDQERDDQRLAFLGFDQMAKVTGLKAPDQLIYDCVFSGEIEANDLEDVFQRLNVGEKPDGFEGHSLSVSDVVANDDGLWYCDNIGWRRFTWKQDLPKQMVELFERRAKG